jgi:hypothetical protein
MRGELIFIVYHTRDRFKAENHYSAAYLNTNTETKTVLK